MHAEVARVSVRPVHLVHHVRLERPVRLVRLVHPVRPTRSGVPYLPPHNHDAYGALARAAQPAENG